MLCVKIFILHVFRETIVYLACFICQYDVNVPGLLLGEKPEIQYILYCVNICNLKYMCMYECTV